LHHQPSKPFPQCWLRFRFWISN